MVVAAPHAATTCFIKIRGNLYEKIFKEDYIMTIKFKNKQTGEIIIIDGTDRDAFNECMGNKDLCLIFN